MTEQLQLGLRRSGYTFHTSAEKEIVRDIKEKLVSPTFLTQQSYVAFDPVREEDVITKSKDPNKKVEQRFSLPRLPSSTSYQTASASMLAWSGSAPQKFFSTPKSWALSILESRRA